MRHTLHHPRPLALLAAAALAAALLAGCKDTGRADATASPETASSAPAASGGMTAEDAASAAGEAADALGDAAGDLAEGVKDAATTLPYTAAGLQTALERCTAYESGSAGASLKAAEAAAALVEYASATRDTADAATVTADAKAWLDGLGDAEAAALAANWPDVRAEAQAILDDPESQRGLLDSAGVATDFTALDLGGAAGFLDALDAAFTS